MFRYERAKELATESPYTRKHQASRLDITTGTLTQYLNGFQQPGAETIRKMAKLYGVDVSELDDEREARGRPNQHRKVAAGAF